MTAELPKRDALETLVLHTPARDVRAFLMGSMSIRRILVSQQCSSLLLPLRGAMPMFWAADGSPEIEESAVQEAKTIEIPIGTYNYTQEDGSPGVRSPSKRAKRQIIAQTLTAASVQPGEKLTLIDEVQGGGTVIPLVKGSLHYAHAHDLELPIHLVAAEDSYAVKREKTSRYRRMANNYLEGVTTTVVKMPLIACDRDALLDRVTFEGEDHLTDESLNVFSVERNVAAESLLRGLGSMIRDAEVARDDTFLHSTFDPLATANPSVSNRLEDWITQVLTPEEVSS